MIGHPHKSALNITVYIVILLAYLCRSIYKPRFVVNLFNIYDKNREYLKLWKFSVMKNK